MKSSIQTILLKLFSIINFSFFWYRQFLMIQGIFPLFLRLWIASISFYLIWLISFPCMPNYAWNRSQFCFSYTAHVLIYLCKIQFVSHFLSPFFHCHFFFLRCNCLCRIVADDHVTHINTLPWLLSNHFILIKADIQLIHGIRTTKIFGDPQSYFFTKFCLLYLFCLNKSSAC